MRKHQTNPNQGTFCKLQLFEHHKIKIQPTEREKIFANDIYDKGLTSKIYRELMQLNNKKKQTNRNNLKIEQKIAIDIFSKKISRWPRGIGKDGRHHDHGMAIQKPQ